MFTGIIEEVGTLVDRIEEGTSLRLQIEAERVFREEGPDGSKISENGLKLGDSVTINGVCQTVVSVRPPFFEVIAVQETLQKTTLGSLTVGKEARVNLERAATLQTRLGGHLVQGHVDGRMSVREIRDLGGSWEFYFTLPSGFTRYIIPQGSVALNGVSLTVAEVVDSGKLITESKDLIIDSDEPSRVDDQTLLSTIHYPLSTTITIKVAIIPHTYYHTNFQYLKVGDDVNVELDVLAKMVERLMTPFGKGEPQ